MAAEHLRLYWPRFSKDEKGHKARDTTSSVNPSKISTERNHPSPCASQNFQEPKKKSYILKNSMS